MPPAALALPVGLWTAILERLPHACDEGGPKARNSRLHATHACKLLWEAGRACEWRLAMKVTPGTHERRLQALAGWGQPRRLTALLLWSGHKFKHTHRAVSFQALGQGLPHLVKLDIAMGTPHDLASLRFCPDLTELRVAYVDYDWTKPSVNGVKVWERVLPQVVGRERVYPTAHVVCSSLKQGVLALPSLVSLDIAGAFCLEQPYRGPARSKHCSLAWLSGLTRLTSLAACSQGMVPKVWGLPRLRALHAAHQASSPSPRLEDFDQFPVDLTCLKLENYHLHGAALHLKSSVRELHLISCSLPWAASADFSALSILTSLRISGFRVWLRDILKGLPTGVQFDRLVQLRLDNYVLGEADAIDFAARFPRLQVLRFKVPMDFSCLNKLHNLRFLRRLIVELPSNGWGLWGPARSHRLLSGLACEVLIIADGGLEEEPLAQAV